MECLKRQGFLKKKHKSNPKYGTIVIVITYNINICGAAPCLAWVC